MKPRQKPDDAKNNASVCSDALQVSVNDGRQPAQGEPTFALQKFYSTTLPYMKRK